MDGNPLFLARTRAGLTPEALSALLGGRLSVEHIEQLETCDECLLRLKLGFAAEIADAMNCNVADLVPQARPAGEPT